MAEPGELIGVDGLHRLDRPPPEDVDRVELGGVGGALGDGRRQLGQQPVQEPGGVEQPPGPGVAVAQQVEQRRPPRPVPSDRDAGWQRGEPFEQLGAGGVLGGEAGRLQGHLHGLTGSGPAAQPDVAVGHFEPAAVGRDDRCGRGPGCGSQAGRRLRPHAEAQQRRGDQRRHQDHEQQGAVEPVVEHSGRQAQGGEDQPDLAARQHAESDREPVACAPPGDEPGDQLAHDRDDQKTRGDAGDPALSHGPEVDRHPDLDEEQRDEKLADRCQLPSDALGRGAATQAEPGEEGADDRRQAGPSGQLGEAQADDEGGGHGQAARPAQAFGSAQDRRQTVDAEQRGDHDEPDRHDRDPDDLERRH